MSGKNLGTVGRMHGSGWGSSLLVKGRGYLPSLKKARPPVPSYYVLTQDKVCR